MSKVWVLTLLRLAAAVLLSFFSVRSADATTFTKTVPGTSIVIPSAYPEAGGVVIVLEGANGNVYYQFSNPSTMFQGYQNTGTPAAWRGNPFQIAPTTNIACGIQSCAQYFGGSIARMSVRFTAFDGDARSGEFDFNDLTLRINGTDVGSFSTIPTQTTNTAGTTLVANATGFGNNTFDTGWYQTTSGALLSNVLTNGTLTSSVFDRDPNDNFWDFRQGTNLSQAALEIVAPGVTLDKISNKTTFASVGESIRYDYALRNIGTVAINSLAVTDNKIPAGGVSCTPSGGTIAVGATVNCSATYVVTQADVDAGQVTNIATSSGVPLFGSLGPLTDTVTVTGPAAAPSFTFQKSVSPTTMGPVGSTLTYGFSFTNTGNVTLTSAVVSDPSLPGLACAVSAIAPGQTVTATCSNATKTVTQAMVDALSLINTASGSLRAPNGTTLPSKTASATAAGVVVSGGITLTKIATPTPFGGVGSAISYSFEVKNNTNVTVTGAAISDPALAALSCSVPAIAPGLTATAACTGNTHIITQADIDAGQVVNTATVSATASGTPVSASASRTAPGPAQSRSLSIVKTSTTPSFAAVNDPVSYTYVVRNTGNTTLTTAVTVTDNKIATVTCDAMPPTGLVPGATLNCAGTYLATQTDIDAGQVSNTATATSGATTSLPDSLSVPAVKSPALQLTKTAPVVTTLSAVAPNNTITYTYAISNTGNTTITTPIQVDDDHLQPPFACGTVPLAPGAATSCTRTYTVTAGDVALGTITNVATAVSGPTRSPQVSATVPQGQNPSLVITKVQAAPVQSFDAANRTVNYIYSVTNGGSVTFVRPVTVVDDKIGTVTCFNPAVPAQGGPEFLPAETVTCTASYSATQVDIDRGFVTNEATAETTFGASNTPVNSTPVSLTVTSTATSQAGALAVTKTVAPTIGATLGATLSYVIVVQNTGDVTLSGIVISDPLFPTLNCTIASLAPGASNSACTVSHVVTQADIDAGSLSNTATASGVNPRGDAVTGSSPPAVSAFSQSNAVGIAKAVISNADGDSSASISRDDVLTYTVTVTNTGTVSQTNVVVSDTKIAPSSNTCASLAPGVTCVLTGIYTVTQTDVDAGKIDNQASVTTALLPTASSANLSTPVPRTPGIALEKTVGSINAGADNTVNAGDTITYKFRAQNSGNVTLTGVTVSDLVPAATVTGGPVASLAPGADDVSTFTATYTLTQADIDAGSVSNTAVAKGNQPGGGIVSDVSDDPANPAGANDPTLVALPQSSSLTIAKMVTAAPANIILNSVLTYAVTASNDGTITQNNVIVTDPLLTPGSQTCATVLPGAACVLTGTYVVTQADVDAGRVNNTARVTSASLPTPETTSHSTAVDQSPALSITKTALTASYDSVGDQISYEYLVTNSGTVTVRSPITVADNKIVAPRRVTCPAVPAQGIPSNGSVTCTSTYSVTQADIDAGTVVNSATASTVFGVGQLIASLPDTATVTATQIPAISVNKSSSTSSFDAVGDVISYNYLVRNSGNVTLTTAVSIADNRISNVVCPALPPGGLLPNGTLTCTATYAVTQGDLDASGVTNTATASSGPVTSQPDTVTVPAVKIPAMTVTKSTVGPVNFILNSVVNYQYVVANTGNVTLSPPAVTDNRIAAVTCPAGSIAPGTTITCTASYTLTIEDIEIGTVTNTATATSGATVSPPSSVTIPQGSAPALTLEKTASPTGFTQLGQVITYTFNVSNTGNVQFVRPVTINDPTIGGFTCFTPTVGNVFDIGETVTCSRPYAITQADLDRGYLRNDATASTNYGGASLPISSPGDSVTIQAAPGSQVPSLVVDKTVTPASGARVGDVLTFNISVTNTGLVTVSNVTIDDPKLPALSCTIATLAPGATSSAAACSDTHVMTQADIDSGGFENTAIANGVSPGGGPVTGQDSVTAVAAIAAPQLSISKTSVTTEFQAVNEPITYGFTVTNSGNVTLNSIVVTDALIPTFTCTIATLQPGEADDFTCAATYVVTQTDLDNGLIENRASATGLPARKSNPNDPDPVAEGKLTIPGPVQDSSMTLVKTGAIVSKPGNGLAAGDEIVYLFSVTNTGNVTLRNISVEDAKATVSGGIIARLGPGETDDTTLRARYTIEQSDIDSGSVSNTAMARGISPAGPVSDVSDDGTGDGDDPTIVDLLKVPSLKVTKVMDTFDDVDGSGAISQGDVLNYVITAKNTGNSTINAVKITDNLITPASFVCAVLPPKDVCVLRGSYIATERDVASKAIVNTATVTADQFLTGVAAVASTLVNASVTKKQFSKTALKTNVRRGERVPYVIELNKVPLVTARVVDLMPPGFTFVKGSAKVNGTAVTPLLKDRKLVFNGLVAPANGRIRIAFVLTATQGVASGTSMNVAQLVNPASGVLLATARAGVIVAPDHVFDCSDILGKVFDDKNRNGHQDEGELGLPGVRVATVKGLLVTTDPFGRFHVPCGEIPDGDIGSNYIMKLDVRTLPSGYRVTTENPRTIRVTRGKVSILNFGASIGRVVRLDLNGKVFEKGGRDLLEIFDRDLDTLIATLDDQTSILRIQYHVNHEQQSLITQRLSRVVALIEDRWARRSKRYRLPIETRIVNVEGVPSK